MIVSVNRPIPESGSLEKPLEYRRLQLQLMTPEKFKGHLCMLESNIKTVPQAGLGPICPNFVTAIEEAEAQLLRTGSHLDPGAMGALLLQVQSERRETEAEAVEDMREKMDKEHKKKTGEHLPAETFTAIGTAGEKVFADSRTLDSLAEAAYFAQVALQEPELGAVAYKAIDESYEDRWRWMDTALREVLARLAQEKGGVE